MDSFCCDEARRFLSRLAPPPGQYLELRTIVPDEPRPAQHFVHTADEALRVVERCYGRANVYVGACPRFRPSGKKADVDTVVAFWVDIDFHQIDSDRERARAEILDRIERYHLAPTVVVLTGNGIQAWWFLHEPIHISDDWPIDRVEGANLALARDLGGDHVQDIARVLRVPGTINLPTARKRARGCVPVPARLLHASGARYDHANFGALTAPDRSTSYVEQQPARSVQLPPLSFDEGEVLRRFERLLQDLGPHHPLTRTWHGRRQLRDGSRSSFDMALACQMARLRIRIEVAARLLAWNPAGKGPDASDSYILRTVSRAYSRIGGRHGH